jgi:glycosyltransferase involved in cell wall biosynthesis
LVSVVVPNHNYNRYLGARLRSVVSQTYSDMEIIFLDDASTDGSVETAKRILKSSGRPYKILINEDNTGSVFAQWQAGLDLAKGNYVWFAESDDACHRTMLARLVSLLQHHPNAGLAYCESAVLDEDGKVVDRTFFRRAHRFIDENKWRHPYHNSGLSEIKNALCVMNTIPNASGVLMRREMLVNAGGVVQDYRAGGDWATYIRLLETADIVFSPQILNYNRFHPNRVTTQSNRSGMAFGESISILADLLRRHEIPEESKKKFVYHYLDQKFLDGYTPSQGEEVVTPLLDVLEPPLVYTAITEHMNQLAHFRRRSEASLAYRLMNLNAKKVLRRVLPKRRV